ncbi:MAG TPA: NUDIX hydrolase [Chloroflexi bacterium]|nr:NUDIX hydrolase [Chloroflexota bacterium]
MSDKVHEKSDWRTVSRRTVLEYRPYLVVEEHVVELPDGRVISHWPWVITPDYVNVVAITEHGKFLCFRQTKYGIGGLSLAPVGGYLEPGEPPLEAAQRELLEETGYQASNWTSLGVYRVDGNRGAGMAWFFLAQNAHPVAQPCADDLEEQELLLLDRAEMEAAAMVGEFKLVPWTAIVLLALQHLRLQERDKEKDG